MNYKGKPIIVYLLASLWVTFAVMFLFIGFYSILVSTYILSYDLTQYPLFGEWYPFLFFGILLVAIIVLVFGVIFSIFAFETLIVKKWIWNAGIIISTIFMVIFSFMLAAIMITAYFFTDQVIENLLITVILLFLVNLGILFLVTRPDLKRFLQKDEILKK